MKLTIKNKADFLAVCTSAEIEKIRQLEFMPFPFDPEAFQAFKNFLPQAKSLEIFDLSKNNLSPEMAGEITEVMQDCFSIKGAALLPLENFKKDAEVKLKPQNRLRDFYQTLDKLDHGVSGYFHALRHRGLPQGLEKLFKTLERNVEVGKILSSDVVPQESDAPLHEYMTALKLSDAVGSLNAATYENLNTQYKAAKKSAIKGVVAEDTKEPIILDHEDEEAYAEARLEPNPTTSTGSAAALVSPRLQQMGLNG